MPPAPDARADWPALVRRTSALGVQLHAEQWDQLRCYLALLCDWNGRFNLTAIHDPDEILVKHFLDSLSCAVAYEFTNARTLADVGTGAGFPGLVLKIAFPHLEVTLIDAVQKRLNFLDHVCRELGLTGVTTLHSRAEDAAAPRQAEGRTTNPVLRERFDVVTARAVARLNVLTEWTLPLCRIGGTFVAMKGPEVAEELEEAATAIRTLGGGAIHTTSLTLPETDIGRSLVTILKARPTPRMFPRPPGNARRMPLGSATDERKSSGADRGLRRQ